MDVMVETPCRRRDYCWCPSCLPVRANYSALLLTSGWQSNLHASM